jgi:hypothetical protein
VKPEHDTELKVDKKEVEKKERERKTAISFSSE